MLSLLIYWEPIGSSSLSDCDAVIQCAAQRLALAAWWENQPTKRKNVFAEAAVLARRVPPSPLHALLGGFLLPNHHHQIQGYQNNTSDNNEINPI